MEYKSVVLVLFVAVLVMDVVQGSCLEYGHSCWGAHGKRSGKAVGSLGRVETDERMAGRDAVQEYVARGANGRLKRHRYVLLDILKNGRPYLNENDADFHTKQRHSHFEQDDANAKKMLNLRPFDYAEYDEYRKNQPEGSDED